MPLPTEKRAPTPGMGKVLIYGPPKIGKSTLAATMDPDHTLVLDTEQGTGALEAFVQPIKSWGAANEDRTAFADTAFRGVVKALHEEEHPFSTVVVDTVDVLAQLAGDHVLNHLSGGRAAEYAHASDFEYGKGWNAWTEEFTLRVGALCRVVPNVVFISHADEKTMETRAGGEYTVFTPALAPKGIRGFLTGFVDHILFAQLDDDGERVLRTQPTRAFEAGGRTALGAAKLPDPLPLEGPALKGALEALSAPVKPRAGKRAPKPDAARETAQEPSPDGRSEQLAVTSDAT